MTTPRHFFFTLLGSASEAVGTGPAPGDNPALLRRTTNSRIRTTTDGANRRLATPTHRARCTTDGVVRTTTAGDIRYTTE